jgi:glutaredoxin
MPNSRRPIKVTILTRPQCGFCDDAQELLQRLKGEYWLSVEAIDINTAEGAGMAASGGILFPPGIFLDCEPFSYGRVSERKLRRELDFRTGNSKRIQMNEMDA